MPKEALGLVNEVEYALEKIEENVKRGGEIAEGLLRYTRKGEEGFKPVDFDKLLDSSMEMVQFKIKIKNYWHFVFIHDL